MKFQAIYRASFYAMLTFATLVLSIDAATDNPLSMLYPPAVAAAGVLAFVTVDRNPRFGPSRGVASLLALASIGLSVAEYKQDPNRLLLAAAHWLVYLQVIKMFLPKTVEDDWFLFLLGLVQVLVGGVMSQSDKVGDRAILLGPAGPLGADAVRAPPRIAPDGVGGGGLPGIGGRPVRAVPRPDRPPLPLRDAPGSRRPRWPWAA